MSAFALTIVLAAALMHASWNALVKAASDRALTIAAVSTMHAVGGVILIAIAPSPAMAPALVAFGTFAIIGETLTPQGWAGLAAVTVGIGLLALQRGAAHADRRAVGVAAALGFTIAAYSVADGIGVRWSESPLGYMGWLFLFESPVTLAILLNRRRFQTPFDLRVFSLGLIGGAFAVTAYGLVLYAKTIAPIGAVSAVRESSVIIAALIGVLFFGERPWAGRLISAIVVALGVVVLATATPV